MVKTTFYGSMKDDLAIKNDFVQECLALWGG
jgi:hypothetical protein